MESLVVNVIPIALGAAVSPVLLTGAIILLSSNNRPRTKVLAYALGSIVVIVLIGIVGLMIFGKAVARPGSTHSATSAIIDSVIGFLLILLGVKKLIKPSKGKPVFEKYLESTKLKDFVLMGIVLMGVNFSTIVLYIEAIKQIAVGKINLLDTILMLALVDLIIMVPVFIPLVIYVLLPGRSKKILSGVNGFLAKHSNLVSVFILFLFGFYIAIKGIIRLV